MWDKLAIHKCDRCMRFENNSAFNLSMFVKQGWRLLYNPSNLVTRLFKLNIFCKVVFYLLTLVTIQVMLGEVFGVLRLFCRRGLGGVLEIDLVSIYGITIG